MVKNKTIKALSPKRWKIETLRVKDARQTKLCNIECNFRAYYLSKTLLCHYVQRIEALKESSEKSIEAVWEASWGKIIGSAYNHWPVTYLTQGKYFDKGTILDRFFFFQTAIEIIRKTAFCFGGGVVKTSCILIHQV